MWPQKFSQIISGICVTCVCLMITVLIQPKKLGQLRVVIFSSWHPLVIHLSSSCHPLSIVHIWDWECIIVRQGSIVLPFQQEIQESLKCKVDSRGSELVRVNHPIVLDDVKFSSTTDGFFLARGEGSNLWLQHAEPRGQEGADVLGGLCVAGCECPKMVGATTLWTKKLSFKG